MIIYIVISFVLENIVSLTLNKNIIIPLFFLISLLISYQFKKIDYEKYLIYLVLLGLLYDVIYTNVYINSLLFLIIGSLNVLYNKYINNSFLTNTLFYILALLCYTLIYYLIYIMLGLNEFNIIVLLKSCIAILPINIIYYLLSFVYLKKLER